MENVCYSDSYKTNTTLGNANLPIKFENHNFGNNTYDCKIQAILATVSRIGDVKKRPMFKNINTARTETLKVGTATLRSVIVNSKGLGTARLLLYDNITNDGTTVANINLLNSNIQSIEYNISLNNGLTYTTEGDGFDVTLVYD